MKIAFLILANLILISESVFSFQIDGKHLFILSGQSNMEGLNPEESFIPILKDSLGGDKIIVVKNAMGGQPIRRWYKDRETIDGNSLIEKPDLYDSLMNLVNTVIQNENILSVTFIWMQGERDARESYGSVYEASLIGLYNQLSKDLGRSDVNFLIGRLNDFDLRNEKYPDWTVIRDIQVKVAESNPHFDWVDTDDLNDGVNREGQKIENDLHMSAQGYVILGKRFAEKSIQLIKKPESN
ncbi:protein of unknown function [Aquiflexum balticum DSM 16537]|uniref:Sialate O-acetylesterase domain-containing protein n=1 Tax=Aquiflexum balticum DSM 16537 TaxID=758820 RepID=A0A1W2H0G9_9BACT|nr:sialate O-acetylesterase [Aquiflexum balticum]SMD42128.1 protein of unknown function [Aquiflexum balticum DSM 16537]